MILIFRNTVVLLISVLLVGCNEPKEDSASDNRVPLHGAANANVLQKEEDMLGTKDKTEEIINLIWNRDEYYIVAAGKDAPSKKEVKDLAAQYGVKVPKDYIAHTTGQWGSPYLEIKEEIWPRHKAGDVGPFWSFLYGVFVYAYSEEAPDWMQIGIAAEEFKAMGHKVLPILKVIGDADVYCFDSNGKIQRWLHEGDRFEPFEGSFFDLLEYEFKELDERRKRKKAEQDGSAPDGTGQ